MTVEESKLNNP